MPERSTWKSYRRFPGVSAYVSPSRRLPNGKPDECFYIRYKDASGRLVREKIGWASEGVTAALAYQMRQEKLRKIRLGEEVITRQEEQRRSLTLKDFFKIHYLPHAEKEKTPKSLRREKDLFRLYIEPEIGDRPLKSISPFDVERVKARVQEAGRSPRTVQYAVAVLRHVINVAKKWGFFKGDNPASGAVPKIPDNKKLRYLTYEEAEALLSALKKRSQQLYEMAMVALYAGLRFGEIANLRYGDIDLVNGTITVRDAKNKESRHVPMPDVLKRMFRAKPWGEPDELVFPSRKGDKMKSVSAVFYRVVEEVGLNKGVKDRRFRVGFHTLRHTYASWLVQSGVPLYTVQTLLGHKSFAMTQRYSHLSQEAQREAVKKLEGIVPLKLLEEAGS